MNFYATHQVVQEPHSQLPQPHYVLTLMRCCAAWELVGKCFDQCPFECTDLHGLSQIIAALTRERIADKEAEIHNLPWTQTRLVDPRVTLALQFWSVFPVFTILIVACVGSRVTLALQRCCVHQFLVHSDWFMHMSSVFNSFVGSHPPGKGCWSIVVLNARFLPRRANFFAGCLKKDVRLESSEKWTPGVFLLSKES